MKTTEEIAEPLLKKLDAWKVPDQKTIVGIEGYSAAGKSTLLKFVADQRSDIVPVESDDFLSAERVRDMHRHEPIRLEPDWRKAPWFEYEALDRLLTQYEQGHGHYVSPIYNRKTKEFDGEKEFNLAKPLLLIEGTFLLQSPAADRLDHLVFLDISYELADARRWERHQKASPTASREKHMEWLKRFVQIYDLYLEACDPKKKADVVISVW